MAVIDLLIPILLDGQHFSGSAISFATLLQNNPSGEVELSITDDTEVNPDREFTITLSGPNPTQSSILNITVPTATVIIQDDDGSVATLGNVEHVLVSRLAFQGYERGVARP